MITKESIGNSLIVGCVLLGAVLLITEIKGPTVGGVVTFLLVVPFFTLAVISYFYMYYKEWKEDRQ